eukprot:TRINITY_DN9729_c0_g3_i5.p3 TRINITY_DN9729_c0_g3~~TRINITY_DN9729_c0_g3_i5.p3  ORF type:complete len:125 (+),score=43.29 TRINITY_DN9729_c0_g3_i5:893-1267(+)
MKKMPYNQCHVNAGPLCKNKPMAEMPLEYVKAYITYMEVNNPSLWMDDKCVKESFFSDYVEARKRVPYPEDKKKKPNFSMFLFLGIAIGSLLVIVILLMVIYIKRRGINEADDIKDTTEELRQN